MERIRKATTTILCSIIRGYQYLISPLMASRCRFFPSCSSYALEAIQLYGVKGVWFSSKRILRCHPLCKGGYDPVPREVNK